MKKIFFPIVLLLLYACNDQTDAQKPVTVAYYGFDTYMAGFTASNTEIKNYGYDTSSSKNVLWFSYSDSQNMMSITLRYGIQSFEDDGYTSRSTNGQATVMGILNGENIFTNVRCSDIVAKLYPDSDIVDFSFSSTPCTVHLSFHNNGPDFRLISFEVTK